MRPDSDALALLHLLLAEKCIGYVYGCECPSCLERQEKTASGEWHYSPDGKLIKPLVKQPWELAA